MKLKTMRLGVGCLLLALALGGTAGAAGLDDFKLLRAVPSDAMIAVHARDHAGRAFVNAQMQRLWAEVEKQRFDREIKRLLEQFVKEQGSDPEVFQQQWQAFSDLAAGVKWSGLAQREMAMAMKVGLPAGAEFVVLLMPPAEEVAEDFDGLAALVKHLLKLTPEGLLQLTTDGTGDSVVHKVSLENPVVPMALTLARHKDVILLGIGTAMPEQALALLRGESDAAKASLAGTERFQQAFKRLAAPQDSAFFIDTAALMNQAREFAKMAAAASGMVPPDAGPDAKPSSPLDALVPLVDALDLWDYVAGTTGTDGMKTTGESIAVLRPDAASRALYKVLYAGGPLKDPLKYVPKQATAVTAMGGFDLRALYTETMGFLKRHVAGGEELVAQIKAFEEEQGISLEEDILGWIGSGLVTFSSPGSSAYTSNSLWIIELRDPAKAQAALDRFGAFLNDALQAQNGGVEDARITGVEGFKRIILPPLFAMIPGLGRPHYGIRDGCLFFANSPEVLTAAFAVAGGEAENFAKNERYQQEGLPLDSKSTGFSFEDMSKLGEQLGQALPAAASMARMFNPEVAKNPMANTMLNLLTKVGNVLKLLDFYKSSCEVTTFDGKVILTKSVTHYQEPPRKAVPADTKPAEPTEAKPTGEQKPN